jgi:hypothetical protein
MEASFHYHGPIAKTDDPKCVTCVAMRTKECPTHQKGYAEGCAHCVAAKGGPCQAHWGLEAALKGHAPNVSEDAKDEFEDASARLLKQATSSKASGINANFRVGYEEATQQYEYVVSSRTY